MDKKAQGLKDFMKDFEVNLDGDEKAELRKTLGKILCDEIEASIRGNTKSYTLFKVCENQYLGRSWWKQRGQRKNMPWIDACDFWAPITEWIECALAARIDASLFSVEPTMTAFAVESSDVAGEDEVTGFADVVMTQIVKIREKFKFYFKQKIKQPLAVAAYEWVYEEDLVREVEHGAVQEDFSVKLDSGQVVPADELPTDIQEEIKTGQLVPGAEAQWYVERDKPMTNQPVFTNISPADYVWTPNTHKGQKPYMEGYRFFQLLGLMRKKQKNEEYFDYPEIKVAIETALTQKGSSPTMANRVLTERTHQFESFRGFTRLPFNKDGEIDLSDPEAEEQEVIFEVLYNEKTLVKLHKWHYLRDAFHKRVFLHGWYEEKDTIFDTISYSDRAASDSRSISDRNTLFDTMPFIGRSMSEKLAEINRYINKEFQQIVDNADLAMCKIFTKRRMLNDEDYEQPEVFPGAFWEVEEHGDIQMLEVGDVKNIGFKIMDQLQSFAVRVSNISSMNVSSRMEGGKPLATEVVNILKEGEVGREGFLQDCHEDIRQIYKWTMDYYFQFMPEGLERRVRGENKQLMFPEGPREEQFVNTQTGQPDPEAFKNAQEEFEKKKYYNRDMLVGIGRWDFKWNGTQLSGDREWQIAVADYLVATLPKFPDLVSLTGVWEMLRDILIARGRKNWQEYLVPRQLIEQLDQQKMGRMQLAANLPAIRQQMIESGMDQQLVDATINKISQSLGGGSGQPQPGDEKPVRPAAGASQAKS